MKLMYCEECKTFVTLKRNEGQFCPCACSYGELVLWQKEAGTGPLVWRAEVRGDFARIVCFNGNEFLRSLRSNNSSEEFRGWVLPKRS